MHHPSFFWLLFWFNTLINPLRYDLSSITSSRKLPLIPIPHNVYYYNCPHLCVIIFACISECPEDKIILIVLTKFYF